MVALLAWGLIVLAFSAGGLADVTNLWWLVLLFGLAAPVVLLAVRYRTLGNGAVGGARWVERELLLALREHGELTPTAAAMLTPLTAAEAAKTLERLAGEGHLETRAREGAISYALREGDLRSILGPEPETPAEAPENERFATRPTKRPTDPLSDPLTDRELAVLHLAAAGLTNKEIAKNLFLAEGTVKAHVAAVYRKLEVHSRAEAVSRAADLDLL